MMFEDFEQKVSVLLKTVIPVKLLVSLGFQSISDILDSSNSMV